MLAVLLLHPNETLESERLIDELWGESPPANALKSLQVHVSRLRKELAPGVLVTREHGYELQLDVDELDDATGSRPCSRTPGASCGQSDRALAAAQRAPCGAGAPLADLAYEPFAQTEIARLEDLRVSAIEQSIEAKLELGRHSEVIAQLEQLVEEHPYAARPCTRS